ncbi:MAG: hypothetical protein FWE44_02985 [Defluviitaleaceae bacterium]|nr:hypothetical protein [Defluviitaleaceae bacterium]
MDRWGRVWRLVIYGIVFVLLISANVWAFLFALNANVSKNTAHEERYVLNVAVQELRLAQSALVRLMRVVAVTGNQLQYDLYWEEYRLDRMGRALYIFEQNNAHPYEIGIITDILSRREDMSRIVVEVFDLRKAGNYQEAIDLAFGFDMRQWGTPFNQDVQYLIDMTSSRTRQVVEDANARLETAQTFTFLSLILLVLVVILGVYEAHKLKLSKFVYVYGAVVLVLAGHALVFSMNAVQKSAETGEAFDLQHIQTLALYEAEKATEELSRLSRHFSITGGSVPYQLYNEELAQDRIVQSLRTLIFSRAADAEVNNFVTFVSGTSALREIEEQAINLRLEGYVDEAIQVIFGDLYSQHGIPVNGIVQNLRSASFARTQEYIENALQSYNTFRILQAIATGLFVLASLGGFLALCLHLKTTHKRGGSHV